MKIKVYIALLYTTVTARNSTILFFGPLKAAPILFLLSLEVSGTSGMMSIYIYIYICQQHGGLLGDSRNHWYYSVNFVYLLLFLSTKNL